MTRILTLGVFDCFHEGHLNLLIKLSQLGSLNVGVISDEAVKREKGENRPIYNENYRRRLISNLKCVSHSFIVSDFDFSPFIDNNFVIAVGEDQSHFKGIGLIPSHKLIILPRTEGISTSDIVKKLEK